MIHIIENAVPEFLFDPLQRTVTDWKELPWGFVPTSSYENYASSSNRFDFSWSHTAVNNGNYVSPLGELSYYCLLGALDKIKMNCRILERVRFGMHTPLPTSRVNPAHVDRTNSHMAALLYINDSDGDTVFYDAFLPERNDSFEYWKENRDSWKIDRTVTPKANTMVVFNGLQFHASTCPTESSYRVTVNYNFYE